MGFSRQSFLSLLAFLSAAPSIGASPIRAESLTKRNTFAPRQATPGFTCEYPPEWEFCNSKDDRGCWLKHSDGRKFDNTTDYEDNVPPGKFRPIYLEITEADISPDGFTKHAQLINGTYPGPLLEACWGDTVEVKVKNLNSNNGTTIHWHGLRMWQENQMDGVNGVTQCPIAEDDTFTYRFRVRQYGSTWYHSHYSSQYTDGVAAPLLIHGPHNDQYDEEVNPLLVADWYHVNAYEGFHQSLTAPPPADAILVNGTGRSSSGGDYYRQTFEADKKYLMHIVNGGTDFHFHFSIDNHMLEVVSADLVPIKPFMTRSLSVGIGQRWSVIVHADQTAASNGRYWMRTEYTAANGCNFNQPAFPAANPDSQRVGIISYSDATGDEPTTSRWPETIGCAHVDFSPSIPWTVGKPQNDLLKNAHYAGLDITAGHQEHGAFRWELKDHPLWLNFSNPSLINVDNASWVPPQEYAIEPYNFNDPDGFVYLIINSGNSPNSTLVGGTHPIHLHGHDFAVISTGPGVFDPSAVDNKFDLDNPPRRDVAMLPGGGHLVIAFKTDNPGVWIMHCHIAWHAGSGLALQILEKQDEITTHIGGSNDNPLQGVQDGCKKWDEWIAKPGTWKPVEQEDSGI